MSFKTTLDAFIDWLDQFKPSIANVTLAVGENYCRRVLKIKKREPLDYRGIHLNCIGSKRWRYAKDVRPAA